MPHIIRLRGPWEYVHAADRRTQGVVQVPCDLADVLGADFQGSVCFVRRFNRPTGLEYLAAVQLALADSWNGVSIGLNGEILVRDADGLSTQLDITDRLQPQNVLELVWKLEPPIAGSFRGAELRLIGRGE